MTDASHLEKAEIERRDQRKFSYHLLGNKNKLPTDPDEEYDDPLFQHLTSSNLFVAKENKSKVKEAKLLLLRELAHSGGDATTPTFLDVLEELSSLYDPSIFDARKGSHPECDCNPSPGNKGGTTSPELEGTWITLSKPIFESNMGSNSQGDPLFSLGRMSFGMYHPAELVCSIQGTFNSLHVVPPEDRDAALKHVPKSLEVELRQDKTLLRSYNITTAFTIEPSVSTASNAMVTRPIEGLMTTLGFVIPNPNNNNRLTVYFDSGTFEVENQGKDLELWKTIFAEAAAAAATIPKPDSHSATKKRRWMFGSRLLHRRHPQPKEQAPTSSASLVTMEEDGRMSYQLKELVGGHETAYLDIVYLDETLRICRSNSGVVYVFARVCGFEYD